MGGSLMPTLPTEEDVAARLASAAYWRKWAAEDARKAQENMTPEGAAADEFDREERSYQALGAIELFGVADPRRVPSTLIHSSPERAEYIARRAEEIRKERESK
jgi:hypothetical protein